ncbi:MAG: PilZ domain-containing protein [Fibrobacteres bacterium]|nr:PilZ domain-containing protein [Fibrobacterota bacterium]
MANPKEKRKKVRIPFIYGIEFDDADDAVVITDGSSSPLTKIILKDISQDGIQVASPKPMEQGREVRITLKFPRWRGAPKKSTAAEGICNVQAVVRWIAKHPAEKYYRIGLGFTKLSPSDRQIVDRYLDENIVADEELLS